MGYIYGTSSTSQVKSQVTAAAAKKNLKSSFPPEGAANKWCASAYDYFSSKKKCFVTAIKK